MANDFQYDVFLSHSAKGKAVVRPLAERLRADGLRVPFHFGFRNSEFGFAKPGMSAHAFGSDWAQLACPVEASERRRKAGTCGRGNLRFRDPLNRERRFIPLRLDDAPIKDSLAQFLYINLLPADREQEYAKHLETCPAPRKAGSRSRDAACPDFGKGDEI